MMDWLPLILALFAFFVVGVAATFLTERVRAYLIRQCDRHPHEFYWRLVGQYVRRSSLIELRLVGIICLGTVLLFVCEVLGIT